MATRYLEPAEIPAGASAVAFTSRRGVRGIMRLPVHGRLLSGEPGPLICAVGAATAALLRENGFPAGLVAEPPSGLALAEAISTRLRRGDRVVLVRGSLRASEMDQELERAGFQLLPLTVYENIDPEVSAVAPFPVAAVFAAAPSAARRLLGANPWLRKAPFVAAGAVTKKAIQDLGVVSVTAAGPSLESLVDALCEAFQAAERSERRHIGKEQD
jgi:uroporphyrinogen-III synthase